MANYVITAGPAQVVAQTSESSVKEFVESFDGQQTRCVKLINTFVPHYFNQMAAQGLFLNYVEATIVEDHLNLTVTFKTGEVDAFYFVVKAVQTVDF